MCSSASSPTSLFLSTDTRFTSLTSRVSLISNSPTLLSLNHRNFPTPRFSSLCASLGERELEVSWYSPDAGSKDDDYGGWAIVESPIKKKIKKKGWPLFLLAGVGTSVAVCLVAIAYFSINNKGLSYRISNPLHFVHEILTSNKTNVSPSIDADSDILDEAVTVTEASHGISSDTIVRSMTAISYPSLNLIDEMFIILRWFRIYLDANGG